MIKARDHNTITSQLILLGSAYPGGFYLIYIIVRQIHKPEALALR